MSIHEPQILMYPRRFLTLLVDPGRFFEQLVSPPALRWPVLILIGSSGAKAAEHLLRFSKEAVAYRGDTTMAGVDLNQFLFGLSFWPSSILNISINILLGALGMFVLYVGIIHLLVLVGGGSGSIRDSVAVVGWGHVPLVFSGVVRTGLMFVILQSVDAPQFPTEGRQFHLALQSHPFYDLIYGQVDFVPIAFLLWAGFLWAIGVSRRHRISFRRSLGIVVVVLGVGIFIIDFIPSIWYYLVLFEAGLL